MREIDWAKLRTEAEIETLADKTAEILSDPDAYECSACAIEGQPCDVGLAVKVERERIIKLIEEQMIQGSYRDWLIALIKGENK